MTKFPIPIEVHASPEAGAMPSIPAVFGDDNLRALFEQVREEVAHEVPDVETLEGRARIRSNAAKVASSKTAIDKPIRDYLREMKSIPKILEKSARESVERFDDLKAELMAPLEIAQEHQLRQLEKLAVVVSRCAERDAFSQGVDAMLEWAKTVDVESFWPELQKKAKVARDAAVTVATDALERLEREEVQAAELKRLQAEAAERERIDRERQIAERAAEQAREQERARAQQEREQLERRAVEAKQREEAQKLEAERQKAAAERAEAMREQQQKEAEARAAAEAERAKAAALVQAENAREDERKRIAEEEAQHAAEAKRRAEDKAHRIKINRAAMIALMTCGIDEDAAKAVVIAIAKGSIPNVKIFY
jgi:hypothetical protein